jgi:hypothetical protein
MDDVENIIAIMHPSPVIDRPAYQNGCSIHCLDNLADGKFYAFNTTNCHLPKCSSRNSVADVSVHTISSKFSTSNLETWVGGWNTAPG